MARPSNRQRNASVSLQTYKRVVYNVGIYARLSKEDKKRKGDSIETQQSIINDYIAERVDLELIETYIDECSGQKTDRPAYQRMIKDMESGKINCCITKDLSRIARNAITACVLVNEFFPKNNIRYIAINDGYDSLYDSDDLKIKMINIINEAYALEVGRKISETKQLNIRNGCFVGRIPPYGYLKSAEDKYKLVPDEYTAPIVRQMFQMVANGNSITEIQKWLASENIMPPKRYFHSIGLVTEKEAGGHIHWNRGVIYSILHNRVYSGDLLQGKGRTHRYERRKLPRTEWILTEDAHEGIVSREIFDKVQKHWEMLGMHNKKNTSKSTQNIFLRKIFCGHCGYAMRRDKSGKSDYLFLCGTRQNYGPDDCSLVSINENELKLKLLADIKNEVSVISNKKTQKLINQADEDDKKSLQDTLNEIERFEHLFRNLYEARISGVVENEDEYNMLRDLYSGKVEYFKEQKRALMINIHNRKVHSAARAKAITGYKTVKKTNKVTVEAMDALIEKIEVFENKVIKVHYKFQDMPKTGSSTM